MKVEGRKAVIDEVEYIEDKNRIGISFVNKKIKVIVMKKYLILATDGDYIFVNNCSRKNHYPSKSFIKK